MMPLSDGEQVAPSHHALDDVPGMVMLDRSGVVSEGRTYWSGVFTTIPQVRVACESGRGTPAWFYSLFLQIKNKRLHHIQTEISV
jgi:hypothetical protein